MEKSRQVLRAEFRAEVKRGAAAAKRTDRRRKQKARDHGDTPPSTLRIVALRAVSTLAGFYRQRKNEA